MHKYFIIGYINELFVSENILNWIDLNAVSKSYISER